MHAYSIDSKFSLLSEGEDVYICGMAWYGVVRKRKKKGRLKIGCL